MGTVNNKNNNDKANNHSIAGIILELKSIKNKLTIFSTASSVIFGALILLNIFQSKVIFFNYYFKPCNLLLFYYYYYYYYYYYNNYFYYNLILIH